VTSPDDVENPHALAQRALLDGLRHGERLDQLQREVRQTAAKGFSPDIAVLNLPSSPCTSPVSTATGPFPRRPSSLST
jgi:hypothetical protein